MKVEKIEKLISLFERSQAVELVFTKGDSSIRLTRAGTTMAEPARDVAGKAEQKPAENPVYVPTEALKAPDARADDKKSAAFASPMVGTFYRANSPDDEPFVAVGSAVKEGDLVCIIEAMKLLNEVRADCDGIIREVLAENGALVEYAQPLFMIERV